MLKVVIISASWCKPCTAMKKGLEELKKDHPDLSYEVLDVDANPDLVDRYRIQSVPVVVFRDATDHDVQVVVGALPARKVLAIAMNEV